MRTMRQARKLKVLRKKATKFRAKIDFIERFC